LQSFRTSKKSDVDTWPAGVRSRAGHRQRQALKKERYKNMARNHARSETREFIAQILLCDDVLPVPITWDDAAYYLSNWAA